VSDQVPGAAPVGLIGRLDAFDARADLLLEPLRRRRPLGWLFRTASRLGDFSLVWQIVGCTYALAVERDLVAYLWFAALVALESLTVNQGVKRLFRRSRPTETGDPRYTVRKPRTSSFPSGHASAAFFCATILTAWAGAAWAPLWFVLAVVVALSRPFVRIHHVSDVIAGAAVGAALAGLAIALGALDLLR